MAGKTNNSTYVGPNKDPLVVLSHDFAPILDEYLKKAGIIDWQADDTYVKWGDDDVRPAGALEVLAEESGIDVRQIRRIRSKESRSVTFRVFELLSGAMGMEYLLNEVPVYRNPMWSVPKFMKWLTDQGLTPEDINVNVELSMPVPWALQDRLQGKTN